MKDQLDVFKADDIEERILTDFARPKSTHVLRRLPVVPALIAAMLATLLIIYLNKPTSSAVSAEQNLVLSMSPDPVTLSTGEKKVLTYQSPDIERGYTWFLVVGNMGIASDENLKIVKSNCSITHGNIIGVYIDLQIQDPNGNVLSSTCENGDLKFYLFLDQSSEKMISVEKSDDFDGFTEQFLISALSSGKSFLNFVYVRVWEIETMSIKEFKETFQPTVVDISIGKE